MTVTKTYGIAAERIAEYFNRAEGCAARGDGRWDYKGCVVAVRAREARRFSAVISVPRTEVSVSGGENDVTEIFDALLMNFLSAGG